MNRAAAHLIGQHDFSAFRAAECQAKSPVKELRLAHVERRGDYLLCDFRADGFLHHMVRNLMGCLVQVGAGAQPPEWLHEILQAATARSLRPPSTLPGCISPTSGILRTLPCRKAPNDGCSRKNLRHHPTCRICTLPATPGRMRWVSCSTKKARAM